MGALKPSGERWFNRYIAVKDTFNGKLAQRGADLKARVFDVSRDGLGVLLPQSVSKGEVLDLCVDTHKIPMAVVYCMEDLIHKGAYRCGLQRTAASSENLVALFKAKGYIDG